jgi:hypothetical protein
MAAHMGPAGRRRSPAFSPAHLAAPGSYARQFIRALFGWERAPTVLVLDDYHEIHPGSLLHAALREGLAEIPEGCAVLVLSRARPPPALAALGLTGALELVSGEELGVRPQEAQQIAALWGCTGRDRATVAALHAQTEGWAAGLVLLLAARQAGATGPAGPNQGLVDYLAEEVLERADEETRRVLLETAVLPSVTGAMAVALTGIARADEILADLARRGYFVARHDQGYRFHALFREFLLGRAVAALGEARWSALRRTSARLLRESGQPEEAIQLLVQEGSWDEVSRIIRAEAPLALTKGRAETVARWIGQLPDEVRDLDPWLLALLGQALEALDPNAAIEHLRCAFAQFLAAGDGGGACLAWAAAAEILTQRTRSLTQLDEWLSELDGLRARFGDLGGPDVEPRLVAAAFGALARRRPTDQALAFWEERALSLSLSPGDPHWRMKLAQPLLLHHGPWAIDLAKARLVSEALRPVVANPEVDPAAAILWHVGDAFHEFHLGRAAASLLATERGLALAAESGLHRWDVYLLQARALVSMLQGNLADAERAVGLMDDGREPTAAPRVLSFHATAALLARSQGELARAREHARACWGVIATLGNNPARYVYRLQCLSIEPPRSREPELEMLASEARASGVRFVQAGCLLVLGMAARERGDEAKVVARAWEGLAL